MTTIATDGKMMAADGMVCDDDTIVDLAFAKLRRLADGTVIGLAGSAYDLDAVADWLGGAARDAPFPTLDKSSETLMLLPDGRVRFMDHKGRCIDTAIPAATGSGMKFALAAMYAGVDPFRAVEIAARLDVHSGGVLTFMARSRG